LLTFSKQNGITLQNFAIPSPAEQMTSEDRLFLFNFDPNSTEKQEDINWAGIDQLPTKTDDQVQGIFNPRIWQT